MSFNLADLARPSPPSTRSKRFASTDARGIAITPTDRRALDLFEEALRQYQTYVGNPIATIDEALAVDPTFLVGHVFRALVLGTGGERRYTELGRANVTAAEALLDKANGRERGLVAAARALADGEWDAPAAISMPSSWTIRATRSRSRRRTSSTSAAATR